MTRGTFVSSGSRGHRSHLMTGDKAFLLPVVIDDTREDDKNVPDRFREMQWTRLPAGETPPAFVHRVQRLVSPEPSHGPTTSHTAGCPVSATTPLTRERLAALWRSKAGATDGSWPLWSQVR